MKDITVYYIILFYSNNKMLFISLQFKKFALKSTEDYTVKLK